MAHTNNTDRSVWWPVMPHRVSLQ